MPVTPSSFSFSRKTSTAPSGRRFEISTPSITMRLGVSSCVSMTMADSYNFHTSGEMVKGPVSEGVGWAGVRRQSERQLCRHQGLFQAFSIPPIVVNAKFVRLVVNRETSSRANRSGNICWLFHNPERCASASLIFSPERSAG